MPAAMHHSQLVAKEGGDLSKVSFLDVFEHTHMRKKDRSYVDEKTSKTTAAFQTIKTQSASRPTHDGLDESVAEFLPTESSSSMAARTNDLFVQAAGRRGKCGLI